MQRAPAAGVPAQAPCSAALASQLRPPRASAWRRSPCSSSSSRSRSTAPWLAQHAPRQLAPASRALVLPGLDEAAAEVSYLRLSSPPGGADIHLFGVIHGGNESQVAEFIMRQRPEVRTRLLVRVWLCAAMMPGRRAQQRADGKRCAAAVPPTAGEAPPYETRPPTPPHR